MKHRDIKDWFIVGAPACLCGEVNGHLVSTSRIVEVIDSATVRTLNTTYHCVGESVRKDFGTFDGLKRRLAEKPASL